MVEPAAGDSENPPKKFRGNFSVFILHKQICVLKILFIIFNGTIPSFTSFLFVKKPDLNQILTEFHLVLGLKYFYCFVC